MAVIIDGIKVAEGIRAGIREELASLRQKHGSVPRLAAVQMGENPGSKIYVRNQKLACEEIGFAYTLHQLPPETDECGALKFIEALNADNATNGIILQLPLPGMNARNVQARISAQKDVEGITPAGLGRLVYSESRPLTAPCTAMAVIELLKSTGVDMKGMEAVIVGHSEIVGKPVALFLLSSLLASATVTVCHIATRDLAFHTRRADILIAAAGKAGLIRGDMVKEGAVVIDVGINRVDMNDAQGNPVLDEKGKPKKKTVGDVAYEAAAARAGYITPVPGGVGPVTTAILLRNTLNLWKSQLEQKC